MRILPTHGQPTGPIGLGKPGWLRNGEGLRVRAVPPGVVVGGESREEIGPGAAALVEIVKKLLPRQTHDGVVFHGYVRVNLAVVLTGLVVSKVDPRSTHDADECRLVDEVICEDVPGERNKVGGAHHHAS